MYISYNWLQEFVKFPTKVSPQEIATRLTNHTVEVESFSNQADRFNKVVVGKVLEVSKHPNADRLRVTIVDVKTAKLHIVCGAPNVAPNQLVAVALEGALLPNGLEIKKSDIRGETSEGMICAEDELGLGDDHEGIMVLDKRAKIGEPFAEYLKLTDIVFEVDNKSLSNRPDLLSHYGVARELSVIFDAKLKPYEKIIGERLEVASEKSGKLEVEVVAKEACPRYLAIKINNLKIKESPAWIQERLLAGGQRPINNVVDLTNYVMLECGQPLHAFDADKVKKISVRFATKGESLETLDGKERQLIPEQLVITDGRQPIALAGIIGGRNSEIDDKTVNIILEAANFRADIIRRSAQKLGLRTEASTRFEKSLDPALAEEAMFRFLSLLKKDCSEMKISSHLVDLGGNPAVSAPLQLDFAWLTSKIGQEIPKDQVVSILTKLGFKITKHKDHLDVVIPSWRATKDVKNREDLVEEVLRIYGYDNIASMLPSERMVVPEKNKERALERKIKDVLALKFGLNESHNYSFVGEEQLKKVNIDFFNHLRIINPLSEIHGLLRQSLVAGLVGNIKTNQAKDDNLGFFEIGSTFFNAPGDVNRTNADDSERLPYQEKKVGLVVANNNRDTFLDIKGMVTGLIKEIINPQIEVNFLTMETMPGWADKDICAQIVVGDEVLGVAAKLSNEAIGNVNLKLKTALAEISLGGLSRLSALYSVASFKEAPRFPAATRDICVVISEKILYNDLREEIFSFHPAIKKVELFDVYSGDRLDKGEKSLAFHLTYQVDDRTMTSTETDEIQENLVKRLAEKFEARLRGF